MRNYTYLLLVATGLIHAEDVSDFSTPPDASWTVFSPLAPFNYPATLDFSNDECRITCPTPSLQVGSIYGGARGGLFAPSVMTDSVASVDITAWAPSQNRSTNGIHMFVLTRVQTPIGLGSLNGFAAVVIDMGANSGPNGNGRNGRLQIMRLTNEQAFIFPTYEDFRFDPEREHRLILASIGSTHTARVFDRNDPRVPLAEIIVGDANYPSGRTGFIIYNDKLAPLDVTFDNFLAWDGTPPPLTIQAGGEPGTITLSSDLHRSLASNLESTTDFTDPLAPWQPAVPAAVSVSGNQFVASFPIDGPRLFFRRKRL